MAFSNRTILPQDTQPLVSQVAGHSHEKDKCSPGMLKHKDGFVLKPLLKPIQAKTEKDFYEGLALSQHAALAPFVPKYYGTAEINLENYKGEVIILEDITGSMRKPCIMDIKIGRQTWDPFATASKIESEEKKYRDCKQDLGFCIPGFQVYDPDSGELIKFGKSYGKSLNKNTVVNAFSIFLSLNKQTSATAAIDVFTSKIQRIFDIMSEQNSLHLYSSSILLTYDCEQLSKNTEASEWANVHMIDFAHSFTDQNHKQGRDENYLNGLRGLLQVLLSLKR